MRANRAKIAKSRTSASAPVTRLRRGHRAAAIIKRQTKTKLSALSLKRRRRINFVVEITGLDGRFDHRAYKSGRQAEDRYFRALIVVLQECCTKEFSGEFVRITACRLFRVACNNRTEALQAVRAKEASLLMSSDFPCPPYRIELTRLFLPLH
jgi:hypothetical protein